jgi:putative ABC transport system permease protein
VLAGELLVPVVLAGVAGLVLGVTAVLVTTGALALDLVTGQAGPPDVELPWWTVLAAVVLVAVAGVVARVESVRLRRTPLSVLLRRGDRR